MPCQPAPKPPQPSLPAGLTLAAPTLTTPAAPGVTAPCCTLPTLPRPPLPPLLSGPFADPGLAVALRNAMQSIEAFLDAVPLTCPRA